MTMTIRKAHLALAAAMAASALISCKKDEDTTTLPYLDGTVSVDFEPALPEYILANDDTEYTMTPKGASHPDGLGVGYQWKVSPSESDSYTVTKEEYLETLILTLKAKRKTPVNILIFVLMTVFM